MRRLLGTLVCVGMVAGPSAANATTPMAGRRHPPAHLMIDAQEYSLWPSRARLPAGAVLVELWNRGQDPHSTQIRRLNRAGAMTGPVLCRLRVTLPGRVSSATWHLRTGRYELYSSLFGHIEPGMQAELTVTHR